jgi:hypothetical protein
MQKENQKRHGARLLKYGMEGEFIEVDAKKVSLKERYKYIFSASRISIYLLTLESYE